MGDGVFGVSGGLARMIQDTNEAGEYRFEGKMYVDGKLIAIDHAATLEEVEDKQRKFAEYKGLL